MNAAKRKAIEAAGWKVGDAAEFLGMSEEDSQLLDARVSIAMAIRQQREALNLTQKELGVRLKTSQPRVAKIERAAADVSMDQLVRALSAVGGRITVKSATIKPNRSGVKRPSAKKVSLVLEVTGAK